MNNELSALWRMSLVNLLVKLISCNLDVQHIPTRPTAALSEEFKYCSCFKWHRFMQLPDISALQLYQLLTGVSGFRRRWSHAGETPQRSARASSSFRRNSSTLPRGAALSAADSTETPYRVPPDSPVSPDAASRASIGRRFRPRAEGGSPGGVRTPVLAPIASGSFRYDSVGVTWSGDELTSPSEAQRPSPQRRNLASMFRTASWQSISSAASGEA